MRLIALIIVALMLSAPAAEAAPKQQMSNQKVIEKVFGKYGREAVSVAYCESRLKTWARNGQYLGLFQMGSQARQIYGHGPDAWSQSRAAYRYFVASGRDWSPWQCRPGGHLGW